MSLKSQWQQLKKGVPGKRFESFYETRQKERSDGDEWRRAMYVVLGIVLSLVGIVLLGMPGPGLLVVAFGLALVASEFLFMARLLDSAELTLRRFAKSWIQWWHQCRPYQKGLSIFMMAAVLVGAAGCAYKLWT